MDHEAAEFEACAAKHSTAKPLHCGPLSRGDPARGLRTRAYVPRKLIMPVSASEPLSHAHVFSSECPKCCAVAG